MSPGGRSSDEDQNLEDPGLQGEFLAWISDAHGTTPNARFNRASVPYMLPDGLTKVADDYADLTDGNIDSAINQDEFGASRAVNVWTGTLENRSRQGAFDGAYPGYPTNGQCSTDWTLAAARPVLGSAGASWGFGATRRSAASQGTRPAERRARRIALS